MSRPLLDLLGRSFRDLMGTLRHLCSTNALADESASQVLRFCVRTNSTHEGRPGAFRPTKAVVQGLDAQPKDLIAATIYHGNVATLGAEEGYGPPLQLPAFPSYMSLFASAQSSQRSAGVWRERSFHPLR